MRKTTAVFMVLVLGLAGEALAEGARGNSSWYIGFGVGGGAGWIEVDQGGEATQDGGVAVMFKVGAILNPHFLLGLEIAAWRYQADGVGVQFNHTDAMATLFPFQDLGLFVKGGIGFGAAAVDQDQSVYARTETSVDLRCGAGWEFQLGSSFNLGVEVASGNTLYQDGAFGDTELLVTFSWY